MVGGLGCLAADRRKYAITGYILAYYSRNQSLLE
jgi:hypothetical protein